MGMELYIYGERAVKVVKTGNIEIQSISFDGQAGKNTRNPQPIIDAADPSAAYIARLMADNDYCVMLHTYGDDDPFCEVPLTSTPYHIGQGMVDEYIAWAVEVVTRGYEIKFNTM